MWKGEYKIKPIENREAAAKEETELLPEEILTFVIEERDISEELKQSLLPDGLLLEIQQNPEYKSSGPYLKFLEELKEEMEMDKKLSALINSDMIPEITKNIKSMLKEKYGVENANLPKDYKTVFLNPLSFFAVHAEEKESVGCYDPVLKHSYLLSQASDGFEYELKENAVHELIHALSAQKHWQVDFLANKYQGNGESAESIRLSRNFKNRRMGILTARMPKETHRELETAAHSLKELNEALVQKITLEYFLDSPEKFGIPDDYFEQMKKCYLEEQEVLNLITKRGVSFGVFVKAAFDNGAYRDLIKKIDKSHGFKAATIISELMAWENAHYNNLEAEKKDPDKKYFLTKEFINNRRVEAPAEAFKRIAPEVAAKHPLITIKQN